ncbi:hypothetical protein Tco_0967346 [Tanacetum coccineum]
MLSRAKKLEKSQNPHALVAHTVHFQKHLFLLFNTSSSVVKFMMKVMSRMMFTTILKIHLASAMLLLAKAITFIISLIQQTALRASANNRNQAVIQDDRVNIQSKYSGNVGRNNRRAYVQGEVVEGMNATNETGGKGKEIGFGENITKDNNYLKEFLEADEREKRVHKQAESQLYRDRDIIRDLKKKRDKLSQEVKHFKQKNKELQQSHLILKRKMSENEDKYHDTILDLEEKLKKNVDLFLKISNSLQAMFMLGPKPLSVYDQQLKHGLGYPNPYTLRQAILECPKLYVESRTGNIEIHLNVRDSEETLEDAFKSQQKMNKKINDPIDVANKQNCWTIDYKQLNALYNDFVPQKESFR